MNNKIIKKGKLKLNACQIIPIKKLKLKSSNLLNVKVELFPANESIMVNEINENKLFMIKCFLLLIDLRKIKMVNELRQISHWLPEKYDKNTSK